MARNREGGLIGRVVNKLLNFSGGGVYSPLCVIIDEINKPSSRLLRIWVMRKHCFARFLAVVVVFTLFTAVPQRVEARDVSLQTAYASALKTMHLFQGISEYDFALERPATRVEAIVMIIRLLGKEQEATSQYWWHPFSDVPDWADNYIGYAYQNGISNGVSDTEFGTGTVTAPMFITYVLRVLGYSDANGDFVWSDPYDLAYEVGLFKWEAGVDTANFLRADVVTICMGALGAYRTDGQALLNVLYDQGVYTDDELDAGLAYIGRYYDSLEASRGTVYDDDEPVIYTTDSDPVVYITPTGKRWHADPDCGGVNSYPVRLSEAERRGLTPCHKCA